MRDRGAAGALIVFVAGALGLVGCGHGGSDSLPLRAEPGLCFSAYGH